MDGVVGCGGAWWMLVLAGWMMDLQEAQGDGGGAGGAPPRLPGRGGGRRWRRGRVREMEMPGLVAMKMRLGILIPS